ncbi:bifunctional 2-keto-4-hydroxyglutarate aldolase/2-keto-3-deoxy-6-phosphogluconate aldolase [[Mycoplasma] testudinis]|uniref:bifunctional 2-keto-4-hydroxyglutarate aldolase/2-keto-3-deoxy-6-phosphogluconate aldolase n=1 Tax=[Mycoplasma] testudinis TaxID=33924 RepID=UPI000563673D|nr:bifunctional 2-keto-4-hydroxyglutarate aldolase/2-keto-3-deoxy-6-phosphogluconate aldolase [[Mycoplasma] testudinis]
MKYQVIQRMKANGIVAVVRGRSAAEAVTFSKAIIDGDIKTIEATFTTPNNDRVIANLRAEYQYNKDVVIGAGTVLEAMTARIAILEGAQFIVSPSFDLATAEVCNLYQVPYFPGCATPTEIVTALKAGCEVIKIFPGSLLTPKFIKDMHGPLPKVMMMPSGGVDLNNIDAWVKNKAFAISIGSALTADVKEKGIESIVKNAQKFVTAYQEALKKYSL